MTTINLDRTKACGLIDSWTSDDETAELDKIATSPTALTEDGREVRQVWQLNLRYSRFLYQLVKLIKPKRVLEIGMANGISSAYIATARRNAANGHADNGHASSHVIIDPFQTKDWKGAGRALLKRLNLDSDTEVIEDYSVHAVGDLERRGDRFDFVFIDRNHCMDYAAADVLVCDRILEIGGFMALDDSTGFGVKMVVPYLDQFRFNLTRVRFDNPVSHWIRETFNKRRRISVYQKNSEDARGAVGI